MVFGRHRSASKSVDCQLMFDTMPVTCGAGLFEASVKTTVNAPSTPLLAMELVA